MWITPCDRLTPANQIIRPPSEHQPLPGISPHSHRLQSALVAPTHSGVRPSGMHHALLPPQRDLSEAMSVGQLQGKRRVTVLSLGSVVGPHTGPTSFRLRTLGSSANAGDASSIRTINARSHMAPSVGRRQPVAYCARDTPAPIAAAPLGEYLGRYRGRARRDRGLQCGL